MSTFVFRAEIKESTTRRRRGWPAVSARGFDSPRLHFSSPETPCFDRGFLYAPLILLNQRLAEAHEGALRISVRGFNQNQLGFTLDDVPLGDMSYGNLNGLHISRAIIDEDMGRITLSQGTGSLETASTSNLGGTVQVFSGDPALFKNSRPSRSSSGSGSRPNSNA